MALDPERKKAIIEELKSRGVDVSKYEITETEETVTDTNTANLQFIDDYMDAPKQTIRSKKVSDYLTSPQFARLVLEISGGVAGSVLAPQFSVPLLIGKAAAKVAPVLKAAVTRMAGAGIGEGSGALVSQTFDPSFDSKSDFNEIAADITKDVLKKAAIGAGGEGAGQIVGRVVNKITSKNKKLIRGAQEAVETIEAQKAKILANPEKYSKFGSVQEVTDIVKPGLLTPGLLQRGQTIDILENVAESSLLGGNSIRYAKEGANTIAQSGIDDFVDIYKARAGNDELGILFQRILTEDVADFKKVANVKYKNVDKALSSKEFANQFQVDLSPLKEVAKKELAKLGLKRQNLDVRTVLQDIIDENNFITYSRANKLRGDALEIIRESKRPGVTLGKARAQKANILQEGITKAMEESPVPSSVKKLLSDANTFYREGAEVFSLPLFKKIIEKDSDLVYKAIVAAGDRPVLIDKTFDIINKRITDPIEKKLLKDKLRGEFLEDILEKSQVDNAQFGFEVDAGKLFRNFTKKENTFRAMFSDKEIGQFEKFQNALRFAQGRKSKATGLPGGMMIQMKQSGAVLELGGLLGVGTGFTGAGASILLGPLAIAKTLTTPKIVKALTLGFKYSDNPSLARRYLLQTLTYMSQEDLISQDDLKEIKNEIKQIEKENAIIGDQSEAVSGSILLNQDIDKVEERQLTQAITQPTRFTQPLKTPNVNSNLFAQGQTTNQGLTQTEQALLSPEEQQIRLRSRGLA
jgi:23S rRNA A2030 N6-methylase RlmJ